MTKRLYTLVKKDFILLNKNILAGIGLAIFTPLLLGFSLASMNFGVSATMNAYLSGAIYTTFILYFYIALEEAKYARAAILLNAVFTRKEIVSARYLFFLTSILTTTTIFIPLALIFKQWFVGFSFVMLLVSFSIALLFTSIFIPFTYRFTIDVTKYILSIFLLALSFGGINLTQPVVKLINSASSPQIIVLSLFIGSILSYILSLILSIKLFHAN